MIRSRPISIHPEEKEITFDLDQMLLIHQKIQTIRLSLKPNRYPTTIEDYVDSSVVKKFMDTPKMYYTHEYLDDIEYWIHRKIHYYLRNTKIRQDSSESF